MGVVYEGRDPNLERRVAIKTVKVENLSEEAAAEYESRFRTEARSAARLQHPNIVSVYDSDRDGDIAFLVMEYIQGDDLKHHLDRGVRYSLEQSLKMIRDLLAALDYAHKAGIVHRDIKPANLLIEPGGKVKLTDFGVARIQDSGEATRTQGSMVGTLKYMAPEQVQGLKIDSRADLFSVGVVLYQLLTDKRPFDGDNDFSIIHQIIGHTPPPPSLFNSKLPTAIDAVVARALAKDRDQRFASARDFASALQSAIRRAEDATVIPPADPFKKPEAAATSKGTVPGAGGGSGTSGTSATSGSTATVTQELELVYWKDIKDSTDPEEFQGFLLQFPAGIYADLARRRLRKLTGGSTADQTVLTGQTDPGFGEPDDDATRARSDPSTLRTAPLLAAASSAAVGTSSTPSASVPVAVAVAPPPLVATAAATPVSPALRNPLLQSALSHSEPAAVNAPAPIGAGIVESAVAPLRSADDATARLVHAEATTVPPQPTKAPVAAAPIAAPVAASPPALTNKTPPNKEVPRNEGAVPASKAAKKPPVAVLAGVGAVVVVGLLAFLMTGRSSTPEVAAAPPVPASGRAASAAVAAVATVATPAPASVVLEAPKVALAAPTADPAPAPAAPPVAAVISKTMQAASAPRRSASSRLVPVPTVTPTPPPFSNPVPAEAREPREPVVVHRPAPAPAPVAAAARPAPPSETCKDRVFLSRQLCLQEECSKPIFANSQTCAKFREEARLREESKVRN